jgi:hypothetical protein
MEMSYGYCNYLPMPSQISYGISRGDTLYYCSICQGLVTSVTQEGHNNFHATFTNRTDGKMSNVLWCDNGNHAFKAGAPGAIHFEGTQQDENGSPVTVVTDACAIHNPFAPKDVKDSEERKMLTAEVEEELTNGPGYL